MLNLPAAQRPIETAGFKWQPEIGAKTQHIVSKLKPKAKATPRPTPTEGI